MKISIAVTDANKLPTISQMKCYENSKWYSVLLVLLIVSGKSRTLWKYIFFVQKSTADGDLQIIYLFYFFYKTCEIL